MAAFNSSSSPSATTQTNIRQVTASNTAYFSLNICNRNSTAVTVRFAIAAASAAPASGEYIEYEASIPANGVLERTGLVATSAKYLVGYASATNVDFNVYGIEE